MSPHGPSHGLFLDPCKALMENIAALAMRTHAGQRQNKLFVCSTQHPCHALSPQVLQRSSGVQKNPSDAKANSKGAAPDVDRFGRNHGT
mmetsp:Transcript_139330/g.253431  ORF Transcript_139330/g.253431 Transcript_139330/m.253431 type:complete len:89 (-) Transcript_139330:1046-1312(-)